MTSSYLYDMHDVIGVNVVLPKFMRLLRMEKVNSMRTHYSKYSRPLPQKCI